MCSVSSELLVKHKPGAPELMATFHRKERQKHEVVIDVLTSEGSYGFEIVKITSDGLIEYFVDEVVDCSPAGRSGLMKDDRIIELNGQKVCELDLSEVQFLLKEAKRSYHGKLTLLVDRALSGSLRDVSISLQLSKKKRVFEDPEHRFWGILRKAYQGTILAVLVGLVLFILTVIILHPKCEKLPKRVWWQSSLIYRVKLDKICSNAQPKECFKSLTQKVDYFSRLNANVLLLTNFVDSSQSFRTLKSNYGTLDDLQLFLNYSHSKNMKVFMDFIPNYTSDEHPWFKMALQDTLFKQYYISSRIPNNWLAIDGKTAWKRIENDYFLQTFGANKPDLNYRNPDVYNSLLEGVKYWCDFGIDGVNMLGASYLFKDIYLRNETFLTHEKTRNQRDNYFLVADLKQTISPKVLMLDFDDTLDQTEELVESYYGSRQMAGFDLIPREPVSGHRFEENIRRQIEFSINRDTVSCWTVTVESTKQFSSEALSLSAYAALFVLPGSALIDLNDDFYQYLLVPDTKLRIELQKSENFTLQQAVVYEFESFLIKLSKMRLNSNSILVGHTDFYHTNGLIAFSRHVATEKNFLLFLNLNSTTDAASIESVSVEFRLKNTAATVEFSNSDIDKRVIKFNENKRPSETTALCSYCSMIISWAFKPLDVEEIL